MKEMKKSKRGGVTKYTIHNSFHRFIAISNKLEYPQKIAIK